MNADFDSKTLGKLKSLIKKHNPLEIPDAIPTYMELCRYPGTRLEEIWSRLFAFFFNPNKPHGFGTMFLDSLNELLEKNGKSKISVEQNFEIETEYKTDNGKKIDLLIIGDKNIICIENKIWAPANNDFKEYECEVKRIKNDKKNADCSCYCILLKPRKSNAKFDGWMSVFYEDFIKSIKNKLNEHATENSEIYLNVLEDWVKTMENEIKDLNCPEFYKDFFDEYSEHLRRLNDCRKQYEDECRRKARNICRVYNYDAESSDLNEIKNWAYCISDYIHITDNCYIDSILWKDSSNELQIRVVSKKLKDLDRIPCDSSSLSFEESGNKYTIMKRKKDAEECVSDAEFIVTELKKIIQWRSSENLTQQ